MRQRHGGTPRGAYALAAKTPLGAPLEVSSRWRASLPPNSAEAEVAAHGERTPDACTASSAIPKDRREGYPPSRPSLRRTTARSKTARRAAAPVLPRSGGPRGESRSLRLILSVKPRILRLRKSRRDQSTVPPNIPSLSGDAASGGSRHKSRERVAIKANDPTKLPRALRTILTFSYMLLTLNSEVAAQCLQCLN